MIRSHNKKYTMASKYFEKQLSSLVKNNFDKVLVNQAKSLKWGYCALAFGHLIPNVSMATHLEETIERESVRAITEAHGTTGINKTLAMLDDNERKNVISKLPGKIGVKLEQQEAFDQLFKASGGVTNFKKPRDLLKKYGKNHDPEQELAYYASCSQNMYVATFSVSNEKELVDENKVHDYYHFMSRGAITPHVKTYHHLGKWRDIKPEKYELRWSLLKSSDSDSHKIENLKIKDDTIISILEASPDAIPHKVTVTTTFGVKLSGELDLSTSTGGIPGGKIVGEFDWQRSKAREFQDLEINQIREGSTPGWSFTMHDPESDKTTSATSYDVEWIWAINRQKAIKNGIYQQQSDGKYRFQIGGSLAVFWRRGTSNPEEKRDHIANFPEITIDVPKLTILNATVIPVAETATQPAAAPTPTH